MIHVIFSPQQYKPVVPSFFPLHKAKSKTNKQKSQSFTETETETMYSGAGPCRGQGLHVEGTVAKQK